MYMDIDSNDLQRYLSLTCSLAERSTHYKTRVGALLLSPAGYIKSSGYNQEKSHPLQKYFNTKYRNFHEDACHHFIHAEISCLLPYFNHGNSSSTLGDHVLFIGRLSKKNVRVLARPCPACMGAIRQVGIQQVAYTTDSGYAVEYLT